jgi:UDP-2,4-diacetamido-2,4,6-trideoxy-beta-L-altropyranose hydrolase
VRVRAAGPGDRDRLLEWANDPVTRAAGFHAEAIPADVHEQWFARRLADPAAGRIWIGVAAGRPAGVMRVDRAPDDALVVSITLAPEARGKGQSGALLGAGLAAARRAYPGAHFRAWIRVGNTVSSALFERAGFQPPTSPPERPAGAPGDFIVVERD